MKKTILTVLQVVVTLGILIWIFHDPQKRAEMWQALRHADPFWLAIGVLAYGVVEVAATYRWQILLRVQGIYIPWFRLASLLMIGIFFNQFMPGGTGGDVVKIYYLLKETPGKKAEAVLAALIDRVVGLLGLMLLTLVILCYRFEWLQKTEMTRNLTWSLLAILATALGGIAFSFAITGFGLVQKLPAKMPFRDKLVDLSMAYNLYAHAWKASLLAIVGSFAVHIGSFYVFYAAARALHVQIPLIDFAAVMPIIMTLASLPISVGGTGVREGLFQTLLSSLCGVKEADAVVISLTGFAIILFWALIGGLIYLFYRPSEHAKLSEIKHVVEEVEHTIAESRQADER